jgi:hypothetical protein
MLTLGLAAMRMMATGSERRSRGARRALALLYPRMLAHCCALCVGAGGEWTAGLRCVAGGLIGAAADWL